MEECSKLRSADQTPWTDGWVGSGDCVCVYEWGGGTLINHTDLVHTSFQGSQDGGVKFPLHVHDATAAPHGGWRFDGHRFRWLAQLTPSSGRLTRGWAWGRGWSGGWGGRAQLYRTSNQAKSHEQQHQTSKHKQKQKIHKTPQQIHTDQQLRKEETNLENNSWE